MYKVHLQCIGMQGTPFDGAQGPPIDGPRDRMLEVLDAARTRDEKVDSAAEVGVLVFAEQEELG